MTLETLIKEQLDPHLVEVDEGTYYPILYSTIICRWLFR